MHKLDKWESKLIEEFEFLKIWKEVTAIIENNETLYLDTDRGESNGLWYFEWVIATKEETLVQNRGHAAGKPALIEPL